jgi:intraflagellar transport protein 52
MRDPPPPALDQFDLDEQFASERVRLAQLTNKCTQPLCGSVVPSASARFEVSDGGAGTEEDVEYYVREASEILGVAAAARTQGPPDAKTVLEHILRRIVQWRKFNQESGACLCLSLCVTVC